ncbi:hypothetical protein DFH27DRAFT_43706 [Peziza echinospora]|nr:hypothetical protein DFH27DRAFT_43706 [Peziza echinospora]
MTTSTPPPQQAAAVATPQAPAAQPAVPVTTAPGTTPAPAAAANTSPSSLRSATSTPATKRRPYEDPTDGERFQLYQHAQKHPELKQKDLVTWFATNFGKEINQSTVSRALKRYRDHPPGDPEKEGRARSKRGGGGGSGAAGGGQAKRRRTGGATTPPGTTTLAGSEAPEAGTGGVEEEAARADEQVQRENQQGIIGRGRPEGTKAEATGDDASHVPPQQPQTLPFARHHHHHHHSLPQQQAQMIHTIPQIPIAPGQHIAPQTFQAANVHTHPQHPQAHPLAPHPNHVNHHGPPHHIQQHQIQTLTQDIDSDSDSEIADAPPYTHNQQSQTDESDEVQLANITKQWEMILFKNCLGSTPGSARIAPTTNGIPAASTDSSAIEQTGILSREALVTYLIGRNDIIRNLEEKVARLDRRNKRLARRSEEQKAIIAKLTGTTGEVVRP